MTQPKMLNITELEGALAYWQKALRLRDWEVRVSIVRRDELNGDTIGDINVHQEHRLAIMRLLDPCDYGSKYHHAYDMEKTLVHELLHIHLDPFSQYDDEPKRVAEEQAVNAIAAAMVGLFRVFPAEGEG